MIYFQNLIPNQDLRLDIIFPIPKEINIADSTLIIKEGSDIVHPDNNKAIPLFRSSVYCQIPQ